ncbi:MAG: DNA helicase UvrBC [Planctomycetes bacterium]|nr:DNA helicase UvrBC [Planctomycetota bacterium]
MSDSPQHFDHLLVNWPFTMGQVLVRQAQGADGRDVLQVRVDLGILQLERTGRPDGVKPEGFDTYYDYLTSLAFDEGDTFELDEERCNEVDREFYQFYHRRICWLTLKMYPEAVKDAQHTLKLMDFSSAYTPDPEWALLHEQYRPFVMFHKIQAAALTELEKTDPQAAAGAIDKGLQELAEVFEKHNASEHYDDDVFVAKLREMRSSILEHYEVEPSLAEQLAEAIAAEQYELAAELRDRLDHRGGEN